MEVGRTLREAREARGLSLREVQMELKIRQRYLEALETENLDLLPGRVYARGFLRSYARFLGLDAEPLVDALLPVEPDPVPAPAPRPPSIDAPVFRKPSAAPTPQRGSRRAATSRTWGCLAVILVAVVAVAVVLGTIGSSHRASVATAHPKVSAVPRPEHPTHRTHRHTVSHAAAGRPVLVRIAAASHTVAYRTLRSPIVMAVTFTGRCWINAVADGRVVVSHTFTGGTVTITARRLLAVQFGNAPVAQVSIDGHRLGRAGGNVNASVVWTWTVTAP